MSKNVATVVMAAVVAGLALAAAGCSESSGPKWDLGAYVANADQGGARVTSVTPYGPAASIGLEPGDVIVQANGLAIYRVADLLDAIGDSDGWLHLVVWKWRAGAAYTYDVRLLLEK